MAATIGEILNGQGANHIMPFFWQHGEDEATLRQYMRVIHEANIGAVCVESRPHPDFCGEKWWRDMDIILDEARKRNMKVWILDDDHFPTGHANGALTGKSDELCRQSVVCKTIDCERKRVVALKGKFLSKPESPKSGMAGLIFGSFMNKDDRKFSDDRLLTVCAVNLDEPEKAVDLTTLAKGGSLRWEVPSGRWKMYVLHLSRNFGVHKNYINMMSKESCRVLIDAVYEPHYKRYKNDFGKTIAGFFSDEPEIGNGKPYDFKNPLGVKQDLPWSAELESRLIDILGNGYALKLPLLWENDAEADETAKVRYAFMDVVTRLVEQDFSRQISQWCADHQVEYIGHLIEDDNQHARTGASLGHFFRGLSGQHMSGVDIISGQILPQKEDSIDKGGFMPKGDREFNHFALAKLASSQAAIDPIKQGRALCEIFGNYGWSCGVRLQKYLFDHFLVRGVNYYVPHAFTPKKFPDPDCPPHFYAHGHNPQYRHFGKLMGYANRVSELISGGKRPTHVAVLYHAEGEWTQSKLYTRMLMQKPARILAENQIDFDFIPQDVFAEQPRYNAEIGNGLTVNGNEYRMLIVPFMEYVTSAFALSVKAMTSAGFPVVFVGGLPKGVCDGDEDISACLDKCETIALSELAALVLRKGVGDTKIRPMSKHIRYQRYIRGDGAQVCMFVNEGAENYSGTVALKGIDSCRVYNAWENQLESLDCTTDGNGVTVEVIIEPLHSLIIVSGELPKGTMASEPVPKTGESVSFSGNWTQCLCAALDYPNFKGTKTVTLPDNVATELPKFSGIVRYENRIKLPKGKRVVLEITDAYEGVELFVNGKRAGIQIVPSYRFDITSLIREGENDIVIEVATTLERQVGRRTLREKVLYKKATAPTGLFGQVRVYTV
jgi:hypothetical protein